MDVQKQVCWLSFQGVNASEQGRQGLAGPGSAWMRWATQTGWGVVASASHRFERKMDQNCAEAALLAEYGRRMC